MSLPDNQRRLDAVQALAQVARDAGRPLMDSRSRRSSTTRA
jgi:hypothetical protein